MESGLEHVPLTTEQPTSELRVWFMLNGATNCYVRLERRLNDGKAINQIAVVDTGANKGKPIDRVVRAVVVDELPQDEMRFEYRYGLVRVGSRDTDLLAAYIDNGSAAVGSVVFHSVSDTVQCKNFRGAAAPGNDREFTTDEKADLTNASTAEDKMVKQFSEGKFAAAAEFAKQVGQIRKSVLGEQHPAYATSLGHLAMLYANMGDTIRAEPLYLQALEIYKSVLGDQHPYYASSLNNLAVMYKHNGDFARAEPLYRQAQEIFRSVLGEQNPDYASGLNNLAEVYSAMADYTRAEPLHLRALEIRKSALGEQHPDYADSLHNLANLYAAMADYARAEPLYLQALNIWKSILGERQPRYATGMNDLAALYYRMTDYPRAELLLKESMDIRKSVFGEQHPDYANSLHNLANLYAAMADYARAEPLYRQALVIRKSVLGEQHPGYAVSLINLAMLHANMGDTARAKPLYKQALQIARGHLDATAIVQSARQQDLSQRSMRHFLDSQFTNAMVLASAAAEPLEDAWQWKGAVTARQQAFRQVAANPRLIALFESLQNVSRSLSAYEKKRPNPPPDTALDSVRTAFEAQRKIWTDRFAALSRQAEDLEQQIAAGSEEFRRIQKPLTVAQVKRWLPAGTAFVDFLEYQHGTPNTEQKGKIDFERRFIVFVVRPDQEPAMIGLGSAASIAEAITAFRLPFQSDQSTLEDRKLATAAANQLRRDLWLPVEAHLVGIDTVIISPDTALGTLPFAALPGKTDGSYLLEDYRIAMIPMASQLRELFERAPDTASNNGLLVLGDVDYDAPPGAPESPAPSVEPLLADSMIRREAGKLRAGHAGQWTSLSGFRAELEAITTLYASQHSNENATVLSRDKASEATFLAQAPRFRTLHLITHGYFEDPSVKSIAQADVKQDTMLSDGKGPDPFINTYLPGLLSGLAMAGANRPSSDPEDPHDGILRSSEIEASSMQGVDLVVLSACETGLGAVAGGEGLTGLQRSFQVAGARSVVASLWKVDDAATLALMTEFYTNLWVKKQSKIDALRNAQLTMLRSYDPKTNTLRRGLGTKPGKVAAGKEPIAAKPESGEFHLDPALWAAFQLSGDWR